MEKVKIIIIDLKAKTEKGSDEMKKLKRLQKTVDEVDQMLKK